MVMNFWTKDKTSSLVKKRANWNQSLLSIKSPTVEKKIKKSFQYLILLKKYSDNIEYTNLRLLQAFLNKYGKIRPRRKTRLPIGKQRAIAKCIRKARALKLIPLISFVENKLSSSFYDKKKKQ
jgi:ribosomal protein S18